MMANYEIVEFIATLQSLIDKCTIFSSKSICADAFSILTKKENKRKSGLRICFSFLNSRVIKLSKYSSVSIKH